MNGWRFTLNSLRFWQDVTSTFSAFDTYKWYWSEFDECRFERLRYYYLSFMASSHTLYVLLITSASTRSSIYITYDYNQAPQNSLDRLQDLLYISCCDLSGAPVRHSYSRNTFTKVCRSAPAPGSTESVSTRNWVESPRIRKKKYSLRS